MTFGQRSRLTIEGSMAMTGAASNLLSLRSSTSGTQWVIDPQGMRSADYLNVQDSYNTAATPILPTNSTNAGNTVNWFADDTQDISGTSDLGNGTSVRVAIDSILSGQTTTVSGGTWTISSVAMLTNDIITVWADGVTDANESTAITEFDGTGNITGMVLNQNVLSIGSASDSETITSTEIGLYDNDDDNNYYAYG